MKKIVSIIFVIALIVTLYPLFQINSDEGQILAGAWNLYNGKIIYKDFFEFIGPGSFYFTYISFILFGPKYLSALLFSFILILVSSYFLYRLAKEYLNAFWPYALTLFWIFLAGIFYPAINHNSQSVYLSIIFAASLYQYIKTKKLRFALVSGALAAIIFYFLQTKGMSLFLFGFIFIFMVEPEKNKRWADLSAYLFGSIIIALAGTIWWKLSPITTLMEVGSGNVSMTYLSFSFLPIIFFLIFLGAIFFLLAITQKTRTYLKNNFYCHSRESGNPEGLLISAKLDSRFRGNDKKEKKGIFEIGSNISALFLLFLQISLLASILNYPNINHIFINIFPTLLLCFILIEKFFIFLDNTLLKKGIFSAALLLFALLIVYKAAENNFIMRKNLMGINAIKKITKNQKIFAFPFIPNFYFELQKPNPYFYSVLFERNNPKSHFLKNLEILDREKPKYILTNYSMVKKYRHTYTNPIDEYIKKNYHILKKLGDVDIWELQQ